VTLVAHAFNIERLCAFADVVIGAVLIPGQRAPIVVTREMVRAMRPRSVILDISIDQGGCVETSRPTTHASPTFLEEGILHYCVPNIPGVVARTATHAYLNAAWPYIRLAVHPGARRPGRRRRRCRRPCIGRRDLFARRTTAREHVDGLSTAGRRHPIDWIAK